MVASIDGGLDGVLADEFRLHDDAISVGELHIAAPYFGGSSAGIERMQASLSPKQMTVYPAIHTAGGQGDCVDLPTVYMNESEEVRPRLAMARSLSHKSRFSHLKLFGAVVGNQHWLLNGSFNCTLAAIDGDNVEAAILRRVSAETFESYFSTETTNELTATEQLDNDYQRSPWWLFWAADLGDRIEIATDRQHNLPLTNVTIELRAGGHRARCQIDKLFDQNGSTKIPWSLFGETNGNASAARLIQINATDSVGNSVVGAALVDDVAALSADPSHRGAWRAAVALLSSEGMPQYADIAALFSLVQDVAFEEEEDDGKSKKRSVAGSTKTNQQAKTAIWPPEPMVTGTGALHGMGLAGGQLHWFDRILASLVRREHAADTNAATNDDDGDGEKIEDDAIEVAVDPRVVKGCERVWSHAFKQFCKLEQELTWMEIDLHQSARLWGPVTFMFLGTLAIQRSIVSAVGDHIETFPLTELLRDSAVMMFCDRDQGDDYSPTSACCYDDSMYPAVAYDLADRFDEYPHPEVCLPWLLAMAHLHAVEQKTKHHEFVLTAWLCFKDVAGDHLSLCLEDREHLKRMWLRYFGGGIEGLAWSDIEDAITRILKLTWHDHDGFAGVWSSKGLIDAGQFEIAEDTSGACLHDRCRLYGQVDPVNARKLKELQMAKCPACETVILPLRLHAVYQTEISLRSEDR